MDMNKYTESVNRNYKLHGNTQTLYKHPEAIQKAETHRNTNYTIPMHMIHT